MSWNTERSVSDKAIRTALELLPPSAWNVSLGGSAFNAIHALAKMNMGLKLGFVGIVGKKPDGAPSFFAELEKLGIESDLVFSRPNMQPGICVSVMEKGEATLLTYAGVNVDLGACIESKFDKVASYLSGSRIIHITSLLDTKSPATLLELLTEVKRRNPKVMISLDPGYEWCKERGRTVLGIMALSNMVFVTRKELETLTETNETISTDEAGFRALERFMNKDSILVVKGSSQIACFRTNYGEVTTDRYSYLRIPSEDVVDSTATDDAFVAGLLAGLLANSLAPGVKLGMRLAQSHLKYVAAQGEDNFRELSGIWTRLITAHENAPM